MMATAYCRLAIEQAQNSEGESNTLSSNTFDIPVVSIDPDWGLTTLDFSDEMRGYAAEPPHGGAASYAPTVNLKARMRPGYLGALLALATGGSVTTTEGVAGPTVVDPDAVEIPADVYRHVFSWATGTAAKTADVQFAPPVGLFYEATGAGIDSLEFSTEAGSWMLNAAMKALFMDDISDPSITPSIESTIPFLEGYCTLTWLAGSAVTKDFSFRIENTLVQERDYSLASRFPSRLTIDSPYQRITGSIPKEAMDADDWAALTAGTTFAATIKIVHTQAAAGSYEHCLWIQMPACQYISGKPGEITNDRRHEASFDWAARYDTSTSKWATITLCNATAAYETFA